MATNFGEAILSPFGNLYESYFLLVFASMITVKCQASSAPISLYDSLICDILYSPDVSSEIGCNSYVTCVSAPDPHSFANIKVKPQMKPLHPELVSNLMSRFERDNQYSLSIYINSISNMFSSLFEYACTIRISGN